MFNIGYIKNFGGYSRIFANNKIFKNNSNGVIYNVGTLSNSSTGSFSNYSTLTNDSALLLDGDFINYKTGTVLSRSRLEFIKNFYNYGTFNNGDASSGIVNNYAYSQLSNTYSPDKTNDNSLTTFWTSSKVITGTYCQPIATRYGWYMIEIKDKFMPERLTIKWMYRPTTYKIYAAREKTFPQELRTASYISESEGININIRDIPDSSVIQWNKIGQGDSMTVVPYTGTYMTDTVKLTPASGKYIFINLA